MRRKNNLTITEIANELGIEEHKVKQIESGAREMPKEKIDEYLGAINKLSKKDRAIKIAEARAWYEQADLKQLIKTFGYKNQKDFAKAIGCQQATISEWCNKKRVITTNNLMRLYYFFNNGFNKKISEDEEQKDVKINEIEKHNKEMQEWYDKTDFIKLLEEKNISQKELCRELGLPSSTFNNWVRKTSITKKGIETLYKIFEKSNDTLEENNKIHVEENSQIIMESSAEETIKLLRDENIKLKQQIKRYEVLLDMIVERRAD